MSYCLARGWAPLEGSVPMIDPMYPQAEGPTPQPVITAKGHNGTVVFDGHMITIERSGFWGRVSIGKGVKSFPLTSVSAIQYKPPGPLVNGYVEFSVHGGFESRSRFGSATNEAGRNENSIIVTRSQRQVFEELVASVNALLAQR